MNKHLDPLQVQQSDALGLAGKTWKEWFFHLEAFRMESQGAAEPDEAALSSYLQQRHGLNSESAKKIAGAYIAGSLHHATNDPQYDVTITLTINASLPLIEKAFTQPELQESWNIGGLKILRHLPGKNIRFEFPGNELITVNFTAKGPAKCQIGLNHSRLVSEGLIEEKRKYWKEKLADLASLVERT